MEFSKQRSAMTVSAIIAALILGVTAGYFFHKLQEEPPATHILQASHYNAIVESLDTLTAANYSNIVTHTVAPERILVSGGGAKLVITGDVPADADVTVEGGAACLIVFGAVDDSAKLTVRGGGARIILVTTKPEDVNTTADGSQAGVVDGITALDSSPEWYNDNCFL